MPVMIEWLGTTVARGSSILALVVGRRLRWNARTSSRPLTALAAVAVLVPVAASYVAVARTLDQPPPPASVTALKVRGELDASTIRQLEVDAAGLFVDVYRSDSDRPTPTNKAPEWTWVADCEALVVHVPLQDCGPQGIIVAPEAAAAFEWFDHSATTPPAGHEWDSRLFVAADGDHAERVLRSYMVNNHELGLSVTSPADRAGHESRAVPWIIACLQIGAVGAFVSLLLSVATGASRSAATRLRLLAVGAPPAMVRRLAAVDSAAGVAAVGLIGVAVGTVGAVVYAAVDGGLAVNYWPSAVIVVSVLLAAAFSAAMAALYVSGVPQATALRRPD